jgi:hypothetical protein
MRHNYFQVSFDADFFSFTPITRSHRMHPTSATVSTTSSSELANAQGLGHESGLDHKQTERQEPERPEKSGHHFPVPEQVEKEHGQSLELCRFKGR